MFNLALDMLCIADTQGFFKRVNPAFTRVLGWSSEELLARPFLEFVHPDDRPATLQEIEKLAAGQPVIHFENRYHCKDGAWRVLSWKSLPQADGTIYATARDVTVENLERRFHEQTEMFQGTLLDLREFEGDDLQALYKEATTAVATALKVERVSIWLFDDSRTEIVCQNLVRRSTMTHESGARLTAADYPRYFKAATKRHPIVADDAHTHPATSEFSAGYLTPLGITSMLDVPILKDSQLRGVICHEHTGPARKWTPAEVEFATSAANCVTLVLEQVSRRQAEARVRDSEARLQRILDASGLGCWDWNVVTDEVTYNGHWARMLGYEYADLRSGASLWKSLMHPDDVPHTLAALRDHLEGRTPVYCQEFRLRTRDGQWRWIQSQGRVMTRDEQGRAIHVSGVHKDVHDRKLAEESMREMNVKLEHLIASRTTELQESEALFRQLAEGIDSVFWMAEKDLQAMTYVSSAYEKVWGRPVSSIASDPQPFPNSIHPGDLERVRARVAEVCHPEGTPFEMEYRIVRPDGKIRFIRDRGFPIRDGAGHLVRMVGIADDITERVDAEREIRQAVATLNATDDGAFIFDPVSLRFKYVNQGAARQLGYTREELLAMTPLDIAPEFDESTLRQMLGPLQRGQMSTHRYNTTHRRKDGHDLPVEISLQYIAPPDEEPRFIAIVRDITERLRMEQRTSRSQRLEAIGTLAGGVAHDLNNALAPILMGAESLKRRHPEEAHILEMFEASAQRGAGMVRQLLTFAKGAEGEPITIQPAHLIRELHEIVRGTFPKNIQLQIRCQPDIPAVVGDATQLHQILLNLCVNARDAMPGGGILTVDASRMEVDAVYASAIPDARPGTYLVLQVHDNGTGIPPEIIERIFDPFFTTKGPNKGTGLGLSTVMGLVKGHRGFLQVHSQVGSGTTFTVYLPAQLEGCEVDPASAPNEYHKGQGETILLVDDEEAILHVFNLVLTALNFKVITATDGADALMKVAEHRDTLSAIITDQHMPHLDGISFVRALRRIMPDIPVAVGSGRLDDAVAEEFKALDVFVRLDKPYTQDRLMGALKTLISGRKRTTPASNNNNPQLYLPNTPHGQNPPRRRQSGSAAHAA